MIEMELESGGTCISTRSSALEIRELTTQLIEHFVNLFDKRREFGPELLKLLYPQPRRGGLAHPQLPLRLLPLRAIPTLINVRIISVGRLVRVGASAYLVDGDSVADDVELRSDGELLSLELLQPTRRR